MAFLYRMRPLTLGLLRDVASSEEPKRLARWWWWLPPRARTACLPMVMRDFGVLLRQASPVPTRDECDDDGIDVSPEDGWRGLLQSTYYLAEDLAWYFKWAPDDIWACPLGEAFIFVRDGSWRDALDGAQRARNAGARVDRLPTRPEPVSAPPVPLDANLTAALLAAAGGEPADGQ